MAYLISDMAEGSTAALQMQKNFAAAPDVQQAQANFMQEQQLKLQQEQAAVAKTTMENTLKQSAFDQTQEAKTKMNVLVKDQKYLNARPAEQSRMIGQLQAELFQPEAAEASMKTAAALDLSDLNQQIKQADTNTRNIENAVSIFDALPPDGVKDAVQKMPAASRDALVNTIGKDLYDSMTGDQVKAAATGLMYSGKNKLALAKIEAQQQIAAERNDRIVAHQTQMALAAANKAARGSDTADDKVALTRLKNYNISSASLSREYTKAQDRLDVQIDLARTEAKTSAPWFGSAKDTPESTKLAGLLKQKLDGQTNYLNRLTVLANQSGDDGEIQRVADLKADLVFDPDDTDRINYAKAAADKKAKDAAAKTTPAPVTTPGAASTSGATPAAAAVSSNTTAPAAAPAAATAAAPIVLRADPSADERQIATVVAAQNALRKNPASANRIITALDDKGIPYQIVGSGTNTPAPATKPTKPGVADSTAKTPVKTTAPAETVKSVAPVSKDEKLIASLPEDQRALVRRFIATANTPLKKVSDPDYKHNETTKRLQDNRAVSNLPTETQAAVRRLAATVTPAAAPTAPAASKLHPVGTTVDIDWSGTAFEKTNLGRLTKGKDGKWRTKSGLTATDPKIIAKAEAAAAE